MRIQTLLLILLAGAAMPAAAQPDRPDRRIEKLEAEMRAVQRKVFPGARQATVEPEIGPAAAAGPAPGVPAGSAISDMAARIDALEAQLARLTGQAEETGNQLRQVTEAMNRMKSDAEARLAAAAQPEASQPAVAQPAPAPPQQRPQLASEQMAVPEAASISANAPADPEQAYTAGFKLWEGKRYADAQAALDAMAKQYPNHPKASWARNLAGRALLDDGKPAAAAKVLFANYETNPKGERAADSLFYLGQALTRLKKNTEACQVYSELQEVYGSTLRAPLQKDLPAARKAAGCS